jgi:parallel beta-helix repeat protein
MKKKIIGIFVCMLLIVTVLPTTVTANETSGNTIYVDDDGGADYTCIQDAIDNASDGDTVFVYSGTYYENLLIDKSICLEGENRETTIIDGFFDGLKHVVNIGCNNVTIKQFSIIRSEYSGINVWKYDNITITENNIKFNRGNALYFGRSSGNTITHNVISENGRFDVISFTAGIWLWYSSNNNISWNTVSGNAANGFFMYHLDKSYISRNSITLNEYTGLSSFNSFDNRIVQNNFIENGNDANFQFTMDKIPCNNSWDKNFWDRGRILPKPIHGVIGGRTPYFFLPCIVGFDWHPALKPYDIP